MVSAQALELEDLRQRLDFLEKLLVLVKIELDDLRAGSHGVARIALMQSQLACDGVLQGAQRGASKAVV